MKKKTAVANAAISALRNDRHSGHLGNDVIFAPGIKLHADPALNIVGKYTSPEGRLLEFDFLITGSGNWIGLHVALPPLRLEELGILGFFAHVAAPESIVVNACLRSGTPTGFVDCFFDKHVLCHSKARAHFDALIPNGRDSLPNTAPWRELVLFLPTKSFQLSLLDLRFFQA